MPKTVTFSCRPQTQKQLDDIIDVLSSRDGSPVSCSKALRLTISEYHSSIKKETEIESKISAIIDAVNARQAYKIDRDFVINTMVNHWRDQISKPIGQR
jgi:hypothetical protein